MSIQHISWSSIELFHNCVRTFDHLAALGRPRPVVEYRAKVKLHGTNCAVQVSPGAVVAQSRTQLLSPEADYKGFAAWVHRHRAYFQTLARDIVVFGEWCGPGVEKGMAISAAKTKLFAVFAVQLEWIVADVRKESVAELEASGLQFAQVEKAIRARARTWYLSDTSS